MTTPSLFCPDLANRVPGEVIPVGRDEAAHLRTLRARAGEPVRVTDGEGSCYAGHLSGTGRAWSVTLERALEIPPRPEVELWMPVGAKDRMLWLAEKATELGVAAIQLVECDRSRSVADGGRSAGFVTRLVRRCRAALTQSRGGWLPRIAGPWELSRALEERDPAVGAWVGDESGEAPTALCGGVRGPAVWLVGPEGGLTEEERAAVAEAGFGGLRLAASTLRFETAGLAGLVWLNAHRLPAAVHGDGENESK